VWSQGEGVGSMNPYSVTEKCTKTPGCKGFMVNGICNICHLGDDDK
jgi:hypothetical protein